MMRGLTLAAIWLAAGLGHAQVCSGPAAVAPTLEIEVLDPNADANGTPAVELQRDPSTGDYLVTIPPVVLVHRYYYSGDRTFQGPMLPGGPSIAVINHPRTGVRVYVPLQMMPGAPKVKYTRRSIEYDFGSHGVSIVFCELRCTPVVKYRNRKKVKTAVHDAANTTLIPQAAEHVAASAESLRQRARSAVVNAATSAHCAARTASTPVVRVARSLPFGHWLLAPNVEQSTGATAAQYRRDVGVTRAARDAARRDGSITTLR